MALYEHTFIASPELSASELDSLNQKIETILEKNKSKIIKKEEWGIRTLAYPIKKNIKGNYNNLYIDGNNHIIKELEQFERYDERIIKFLSIKIKKIPEENSELLKNS